MNRSISFFRVSGTWVIILFFFFLTGGYDSKSGIEKFTFGKEVPEKLGPNPLRFPQLSIRVEKYLLPAVSTGPLDPDWSPDGRWLTFSMRGDIWKMPAGGGEAVALTQGPAYYFEPAWSPDGKSIAFTVDRGERLEIGVVSAEGKDERLVVTDSEVNIEPDWSADGTHLYFVSDRGRGLGIFSVELATGDVTAILTGRGNQIQPAVSPDGKSLAYVAPVERMPGSGGIWIMPLPSGTSQLIHYEETRYRVAPDWMPDGQSIVYVSEITGNNDIAIIPVQGGAPVWITHAQGDELSPVISPDGERLAFVSNRSGPARLFTMPAGGGSAEAWRKAAVTSLQARRATGQLRLRVLGPDGQPVAARVYLEASDGRSYAPGKGFHRVVSAGEQHYFHTDGSDTVTVPAGTVRLEAMKGFEYKVVQASIEVPADGKVQATLRFERIADSPARGWYSGDTHAHDLHGGRYGLTHEDFFKQLRAEDIHVTNALIHMDGTRLMGRWEDLTGRPHPLSTAEHILQYGEEFRGSRGHVGLLGISEFIMPLVGGAWGTAYAAEVLNARYLDEARAQGGIGGFMHPYGVNVEEPGDGLSEIPVDVALGKGSFYDVINIPYDALENAEMYYRLLNSGFQLAASGGSDPFPDVWRDPPPGMARTYALVDGPLTADSWLEAVKAGCTFATNGPLLFINVEGQTPGGEIRLTGNDPAILEVQGEVISLAPLLKVEVLLNGKVARSIDMRDKNMPYEFSVPVKVADNGWIAVRALGSYSRYLTDSYPFAQTTPVYVLRNGQRYTSPEDATFLYDAVDALWQSVMERDRWHSEAEKERYRKAVEEAKEVYQSIARGNYSFEL